MMWSKQAADTRNKNMTSFKNKITNRKRKNGIDAAATPNTDDRNTNTTSDEKKPTSEPAATTTKKNQRANRNKTRNKNSTSKSDETAASHVDRTDLNPVGNDDDISKLINIKDLETADVVLRNVNNSTNNPLKRYSDSYVIDNNTTSIKEELKKVTEKPEHFHVLTRAVSGFFVIDQARRNRRLSDIFRHGNMKLSNSTENLQIHSKDVDAATKKGLKKCDKTKDNNNLAKKQTAPLKPAVKGKSAKKDTITPLPETNSYLKRVKSKIYKCKSDTVTSTLPSTKKDKIDLSKDKKTKTRRSLDISSRIPEDEVAVLSPQHGLRKSLTHFDFRLTRQTSNLERIRSQKSSIDEVDRVCVEKPVLAKAKSSSAINLNLLRTRRNKILDQNSLKSNINCKCVQDEFDFIAFGGIDRVFGSQASLNKPTWLHYNKGEVKSGQPVSRSGSDRRPDAVREESFRQESGGKADNSYDFNHDKDDNSTSESAAAAPTSGNRRRTTTNLNRSESAKGQSEKKNKRRHTSDPLHTKSSGGVELEQQPGLSNTDSGSSSNSSISCNGRLSESPSNSVDAVAQGLVRGKSDSDSDIDGEGNKDWQELVTEEELKNLNPQEKKRQDVINEFFQTESSHVRNLKVLYNIFYKKLLDSQTVKTEELSLIFPNIKEMLDIHTEFNKEMMRRRKKDPIVKEVGDMLVQMFEGEKMQRAAATFCERQQSALEFIKERRKRDSKFDLLLAECEKRRQCRRLQLQGIIPTEMQRLSKYPLLLGRLIQSVEADATSEQSQDEIMKLRKAHQMSKEILNYVNEAAKLAMNKVRLEDIQRHLDTSSFDRLDHAIVGEFRPLDLTRFNLLIEGGMQLHRPNKAIVPVHILLLEEAVIILHLEGDRFFLKFFQSGNTAQPQPLSPIIKINTLLVRRNAVSKNALFLVNTSTTNSQMYNLYAEDESKRDTWLKHFTDASDTYNKREGKTKRHDQSSSDFDDAESSESVQDLRVRANQSEKADTTIVDDPPSSANSKSEPEEPVATESSDQEQEQEREVTASPEMVAGGGVQRVSAEDWPLIQPSQVNIAIPPVHTAESMLTPIEQIKRKDAVVKQALAEKERLVGDLLNIPSEEFPTIVDMISHDPSRRNPSELVLSAIVQVHQLNLAVNQSLNISDADAVATKGGKHASCASQVPIEPQSVPSVSAHVVQEVAQCLSTQLTTLLSELKQIEDERDRLRRELHNVRERLHEEHHLHDPIRIENPDDSTPTESSNQDSAPQEVSSKNEGELVSEQD